MSEQLDLFHPQQTVIERCLARHRYPGQSRHGCIVIYDATMTKAIREEWCRHWCPLLNERIE